MRLWSGLEGKLADIAAKRNLKDETVGPVITWTTKAMLDHVDNLLKLSGMPTLAWVHV